MRHNVILLSAVLVLPLFAVGALAAPSTGFESPFVPGPLGGQQGWTTTATGINISTANPASGLQHLRFTQGNALQNATTAVPVTTPSLVTMTFGLANTASSYGGTDRDIQVLSSTGVVLAGFKLSFTGQTAAYKAFPSFPSGYDLEELPFSWDRAGIYHTWGISINQDTSQLTYTYDGATVFTTPAFHGTALAQLSFKTDNFYVSNESFDIDNLVVTTTALPEPSTAAAMLALTPLLTRRRRT